jgi:hypothetical protein
MHPLHAPVATTLNPCLSSPRPRLASGAEVSCGPEGVIGPAYQNAPVRENARQRHSAWRSEQKCFDLFCPLLLSKSTFAMPYCGSQRDSHVSVLIQPQTIDEGGEREIYLHSTPYSHAPTLCLSALPVLVRDRGRKNSASAQDEQIQDKYSTSVAKVTMEGI